MPLYHIRATWYGQIEAETEEVAIEEAKDQAYADIVDFGREIESVLVFDIDDREEDEDGEVPV